MMTMHWTKNGNQLTVMRFKFIRMKEVTKLAISCSQSFTSTWLALMEGYCNTRIAQQYKSQVQSIIRTCHLQLAEYIPIDHKQPGFPAIYSLLIPGQDGVTVLKSWLSYAVAKYQPATVRSYLTSVCPSLL